MFRLTTVFGMVLLLGLLLVPVSVQAQTPPPVCGFYGMVTLDGALVANGTVVKAWIDGTEVKSSTTTDSQYNMYVAGTYQGKVVTFTVDAGLYTAALSGVWDAGANKRIVLDAFTANAYVPPAASGATPGIHLSPQEGIVTTVVGEGFTPAFEISLSWLGGLLDTVPNVVTADSNGSFSALVIMPTSVPGAYVITANDVSGNMAEATFTVVSLKGEQGVMGIAGQSGADGETGPAGIKGDAGPAGLQGDPGEKGDKGDKGGSGGIAFAVIAMVVSLLVALLYLSDRRNKRRHR